MSTALQVQGQQYQQLVEALTNAFPNVGRLTQLLQFRLSKNLAVIVDPANPLQQVAFDLVAVANAEGWTGDLLVAARESVPGNPKLLKLSQDFGLTAATAELERMVRADLDFLKIAEWRQRLGEIEVQVCRVETPYEKGTGFLVGPDTVLTNFHVMERVIANPADATRVVLRFDYKELATGAKVSEGTEVRLAKNWLVDSSPYSNADKLAEPGDQTPSKEELDYALLRLDDDIGEQPVAKAKADPSTPKRGWIVPKPDFAFPSDAPIFIVQHPQAKPLKLALETKAVISLNNNGTRVRYRTNTEPGSSGSPAFDYNWDWVALHHSGDRRLVPVYNQGIPVRAIVDLLTARGKKLSSA